MDGIFHSDSGGRCFRCGATLHRYVVQPDGHVETFCYTCHASNFFYLDTEPRDVRDVSRAHRGED